ncbi:TRAP transporter small permease [Planktotalea sp.]|uniref:TRAP transporter small permease n=1 Tax=Planktotalea sp. TaxID=2029877 RepID=UPI003D6C3DE4
MLKFITKLAHVMAVLGGLVLTALVLLVCISVLGRGGNTFAHWDALQSAAPGVSAFLLGAGIGPVPGDFEIVEAAVAFAIFAFLPLCQLRSAHATVDVFTSFLPARTNVRLKAFWEVVLCLAILLITWRLGVGMSSKIANGETTLLLGFPKWWAFAASFVAAIVASIVALYCAFVRTTAAIRGAEADLGQHEAS